ncbi:MAG: hypothetical protein MHM6MM_000636 [Cercozoa sp. M6MM]
MDIQRYFGVIPSPGAKDLKEGANIVVSVLHKGKHAGCLSAKVYSLQWCERKLPLLGQDLANWVALHRKNGADWGVGEQDAVLHLHVVELAREFRNTDLSAFLIDALMQKAFELALTATQCADKNRLHVFLKATPMLSTDTADTCDAARLREIEMKIAASWMQHGCQPVWTWRPGLLNRVAETASSNEHTDNDETSQYLQNATCLFPMLMHVTPAEWKAQRKIHKEDACMVLAEELNNIEARPVDTPVLSHMAHIYDIYACLGAVNFAMPVHVARRLLLQQCTPEEQAQRMVCPSLLERDCLNILFCQIWETSLQKRLLVAARQRQAQQRATSTPKNGTSGLHQ